MSNTQNLYDVLKKIPDVNQAAYKQAVAHLDNLAKPPGSLGKLEEIAARLAAIGGMSVSIDKRCVVVLAADNGVVAEGVASAPQSVTAVQTLNILKGITGVGVIAKNFNADLLVADVGSNADISHPLLFNRKIRKSTGNILLEVAMTKSEVVSAIETGIELALMAKDKGYNILGVGEMGIGNTTTSSAVLCALLGLKGDEVSKTVGVGAGLSPEGYDKKVKVIQRALSNHSPSKDDPIDILSKVGGLDLAAMTGVFIGGAYLGLPVVIDGFISSVAALCAVRLNPKVKEFIFASHCSEERGYTLAVKELGLSPCLDLNMRLGEGSGCPLMFGVMDAALSVLKNMATFQEAMIDSEYLETIKDMTEM